MGYGFDGPPCHRVCLTVALPSRPSYMRQAWPLGPREPRDRRARSRGSRAGDGDRRGCWCRAGKGQRHVPRGHRTEGSKSTACHRARPLDRTGHGTRTGHGHDVFGLFVVSFFTASPGTEVTRTEHEDAGLWCSLLGCGGMLW